MAKNLANWNQNSDSPTLARADLYEILQDLGYEDTGDVSRVTTTGEADKLVKTDSYGVLNLATLKITDKIILPSQPRVYGVRIDVTNSNPETAVTYTDAAIGFTPASGGDGTFSWGDWETIIKNEFGITPCVLQNDTGGDASVNYYLDYDNYDLKSDGATSSDLTGGDGDVMVEFGIPLWWKFTNYGDYLTVQLSAFEFDGAVKTAFEIEDGYNQVSWYPLMLTQILYLLMFKSRDSQTALGKGRTDADTYTDTGVTDAKTFCYGSTDDEDNVKFLGMEDYWGNRRWWIDGCFYDANRHALIGTGSFNNTGSGYSDYGQVATADGGDEIKTVQGSNNLGFMPDSMTATTSTYYCDTGYIGSARLSYFGGFLDQGISAGGFYLSSNSADYSNAILGGRLCYKGNNKLYIGAYLGYTTGEKLRSVSGQESRNAATIGTFRTEATENNA